MLNVYIFSVNNEIAHCHNIPSLRVDMRELRLVKLILGRISVNWLFAENHFRKCQQLRSLHWVFPLRKEAQLRRSTNQEVSVIMALQLHYSVCSPASSITPAHYWSAGEMFDLTYQRGTGDLVLGHCRHSPILHSPPPFRRRSPGTYIIYPRMRINIAIKFSVDVIL